jgi:hypothetical protein
MRPPSSITRHSRMEERASNLSPERIAVERALDAATEPMSTPTVARHAGITHVQATAILQRLRADGKAVNVSTNRNARWRRPTTHRTALESHKPINTRSMGGTYDGAELRPFDKRAGAMDFKKWPSRGLR